MYYAHPVQRFMFQINVNFISDYFSKLDQYKHIKLNTYELQEISENVEGEIYSLIHRNEHFNLKDVIHNEIISYVSILRFGSP